MKWTEAETSKLGEARPMILELHHNLLSDRAQSRPDTDLFLECFTARFTKTVDLPQMLLSSLMTRDGLAWYRSLANESFGICHLSQTFVDGMAEPKLRQFAERMATDWPAFREAWRRLRSVI
jgi:hypothetical protein